MPGLLGSTARGVYCKFIDALASDRGADYETTCPPELTRLLAALSMPTPASGFVLNSERMAPILEQIAGGKAITEDIRGFSALLDNCPCIADLMTSALCPGGVLPKLLQPAMLHIAQTINKFIAGISELYNVIQCLCCFCRSTRAGQDCTGAQENFTGARSR